MASLGSTPGLIVAAGVGAAASAALNPAFEVPKQEAWSRNAQRLINVGTVAELIARGGVILGARDGSDGGTAYAEALRQGYAGSRLDRLVWLAQRMPDYGTLKSLANRGLLDTGQVPEALNRHAFPADWHKPLTDLFSEILSPGEIAAAIHRGLIPDPGGLLKGQQPQPPFNVEAYPVYDIPALAEAAGHGYDRDRLGVLVGLQGLPMGPHEAAQAVFRGILTPGDYIRAFNESNNRNEWAEAIFEQTRQIPTARDFFENALRGYHELPWAQEQAKRHGMSEADSLVIYQNQGRPMNPRAIVQALARGGKFKPEPGELKNPFDAAIVEGNLKPAYYDLAYANRYSYSVPFWWRTLLTSRAITSAEAEQLLLNLGNPPDLAKKVTDHFATNTASATIDARVKSAQTSAVNALHKRFLMEQTDDQGVTTGLAEIDIAPGSADQMLKYWTFERLWSDKLLSPAQIKKAYSENTLTLDESVARLVQQHYGVEDARIYLQS